MQTFRDQLTLSALGWQQQIVRIGQMGFFHLLSANLLIQFMVFGAQLAVAGLLTPVELGQIRIMQSFMAIGSIVAGFGFTTSTLKLCSERRSENETYSIYRSAVRFSIYPILGTVLAVWGLSKTGFLSLDPVINALLPVYALMLVPFTYSSLSTSYLQARRKFKAIANAQIITKILAMLVLIVCTYFFALAGYVVAIVIGVLLTQLWLQRLLLSEVPKGTKNLTLIPVASHWFLARYAFLSNVVNQIALNLDVLILNYLLADRVQIGYYGFATICIVLLRMYTVTVQQIATPYFSAYAADIQKWRDTLRRYQILLFLSSLGILLLSNWLFPLLVRWTFGPKYIDSIPFFRILSLAWFIRSLTALPGIALLGLGKVRINFLTTFLNLPVTIVAILWAYNNLGLHAVPWAVVVSAVSLTILVWVGFYIEIQRSAKERI